MFEWKWILKPYMKYDIGNYFKSMVKWIYWNSRLSQYKIMENEIDLKSIGNVNYLILKRYDYWVIYGLKLNWITWFKENWFETYVSEVI